MKIKLYLIKWGLLNKIDSILSTLFRILTTENSCSISFPLRLILNLIYYFNYKKMVISYPKDIERKDKGGGVLETINLPYGLSAYYYEGEGYLSLYSKGSVIKKLSGLTQGEAECLIIGVISTYDLVISTFYQDGFIYVENRTDKD